MSPSSLKVPSGSNRATKLPNRNGPDGICSTVCPNGAEVAVQAARTNDAHGHPSAFHDLVRLAALPQLPDVLGGPPAGPRRRHEVREGRRRVVGRLKLDEVFHVELMAAEEAYPLTCTAVGIPPTRRRRTPTAIRVPEVSFGSTVFDV